MQIIEEGWRFIPRKRPYYINEDGVIARGPYNLFEDKPLKIIPPYWDEEVGALMVDLMDVPDVRHTLWGRTVNEVETRSYRVLELVIPSWFKNFEEGYRIRFRDGDPTHCAPRNLQFYHSDVPREIFAERRHSYWVLDRRRTSPAVNTIYCPELGMEFLNVREMAEYVAEHIERPFRTVQAALHNVSVGRRTHYHGFHIEHLNY